jgi:hypothetical protein
MIGAGHGNQTFAFYCNYLFQIRFDKSLYFPATMPAKEAFLVEHEVCKTFHSKGQYKIDVEAIRSYVNDLANILEESEVAQRKAFLRSFIKKIVVDKDRAKLYYNLPVPPDGKKMETVGVLPIDNLGENFMQLIRAVGIYHPNYKLLTLSTGVGC